MEFRPLTFPLARPQSLCHTNRQTQFVKIVKSRTGHLKTCKSVKNRKSKVFTIPILPSYIEVKRLLAPTALTEFENKPRSPNSFPSEFLF